MYVPIYTFHFFFGKYTETSIFFGKIDLSRNSGLQWPGDNKEYKKKKNYIIKTQQKMVTKLGQLLYISAF